MEFDSPAHPAAVMEPLVDLNLSLEELDAILEVDVVDSVPIGLNETIPCWVARTVYGEDNPRWMMFREWLLADAPRWFRGLYIRHGRSFAKVIAPHEGVKSVIRRWMDSVIGK